MKADPGIVSLTADLCEHACSVVGPANEALFARIDQEVPLTVHRFASGETYNGWTVPQDWRVQRATIRKDGELLYDCGRHPLGVGYYSRSFQGALSLEELQPHVVSHPHLDEAHVFHCMWQYRPWQADWVLSVPRSEVRSWTPGRYEVDLETVYQPGEMLVGEYEVRGRSEKTIVFNSHTCHPHMANDGLVGVATWVRLMQWLQTQDPYYTYRLVIGPEHLGTVFYLRDQPVERTARCQAAIFAEMHGTEGPIKAASTFLGDQAIDRAIRHAARHHAAAHVEVPWRCGAGNDETVWEAPGYEVPCVELTRCIDQFDPYPEYHSDFDTPERMNASHVNEFYGVLQKAVEVLEGDATIERCFDGLICLSHPQYDLYLERPDPAVDKNLEEDSEKWGHLLDSLFRYFDGRITVLDIAEKHDLSFDRLLQYLRRFEQKGLIQLRRSEIARPPASRRDRRAAAA